VDEIAALTCRQLLADSGKTGAVVNVIIFAAVDLPDGPATTARVRQIARLLSLAGHRVTVASLQANAKTPYPGNSRTQGEFEGIRYLYLTGNTVRPIGFWRALLDTARGCLAAASYLVRMAGQDEAEMVIYYTPDFFNTLPSLLVAKLRGMTTILELCEIYSVGYAADLKQRIRVLMAGLSDRLLPRLCDGVVVISTRIRDKIAAEGVPAERIFHLPVLVDAMEFSHLSGAAIDGLAGKTYFLNSGSLGEKDGASYLVAALAEVCRARDDVYLVFTGKADDANRVRLMEMATGLGVAGHIIFTGFLPKAQLIWGYQHAAALLCCRIDDPFANYGSPTKLCEYLATGTPVITNMIGDNGVYLAGNRNAFIARPQDSSSIAEQMLLVLKDPCLAQKIGQGGREVAEQVFHYGNYVSSLDRFLKKVSGYHKYPAP
jgi:glycosyltransferase involved in cell wall biosynthesis